MTKLKQFTADRFPSRPHFFDYVLWPGHLWLEILGRSAVRLAALVVVARARLVAVRGPGHSQAGSWIDAAQGVWMPARSSDEHESPVIEQALAEPRCWQLWGVGRPLGSSSAVE